MKCPENQELLNFILNKQRELKDSPKGLSDNINKILTNASFNVCASKTHIKTLKDFSNVKGVGKWILKLMRDFFVDANAEAEMEERIQRAEKKKGSKKYVPQKNSAAYALLITLYRGTSDGVEYMRKQELIDAAEASGLSRTPIMTEIGKGKAGQFGVSSSREWYSGWNCMKNLINKGLAVKTSCPGKYMLTEQGKEAARDCLSRSGLTDSTEGLASINKTSDPVIEPVSMRAQLVEDSPPQRASSKRKKKSVDIPPDTLDKVIEPVSMRAQLVEDSPPQRASSKRKKKSVDIPPDTLDKVIEPVSMRAQLIEDSPPLRASSKQKKKSVDIPPDTLDKLVRMGYTKQQVTRAFSEVAKMSPDEETSSLWLSVLCRLREVDVYNSPLESENIPKVDNHPSMRACSSMNKDGGQTSYSRHEKATLASERRSEIPSSSIDQNVHKRGRNSSAAKSNILSMPPLAFGDRFEDAYEVVLVLDDREKFTRESQKSRRFLEQVKLNYKIPIEVRRLPVGDGIWIARHKQLGSEYVLDFIVERKNVVDLRSSIRDNRYKEQKVRILRSGLKRLIYLVEGDPNACESAESIKTACMTTEILEGFDVQRTSGLGDTLRKYGNLTQSITECYKSLGNDTKDQDFPVCPSFDQFIDRCKELDEMTVSDVFATQLLQVPQVTEEVAIAVLDLYPTVISLARAYSHLDGDTCGQEELLKKQSNDVISRVASRNIFQFIWGD